MSDVRLTPRTTAPYQENRTMAMTYLYLDRMSEKFAGRDLVKAAIVTSATNRDEEALLVIGDWRAIVACAMAAGFANDDDEVSEWFFYSKHETADAFTQHLDAFKRLAAPAIIAGDYLPSTIEEEWRADDVAVPV